MRIMVMAEKGTTPEDFQRLIESLRSLGSVINTLNTLQVVLMEIDQEQEIEIMDQARDLPHVRSVCEDGIVRLPESPVDPLDRMRW